MSRGVTYNAYRCDYCGYIYPVRISACDCDPTKPPKFTKGIVVFTPTKEAK